MIERDVATGLLREFFDHLSQANRDAFISRITRPKGKKVQIVTDGVHTIPLDRAVHDQLMAW
jgi:hypothetical protein